MTIKASETLPLDGTWEARVCAPGEGETEGWQQGFEGDFDARVPGHGQADLVAAEKRPDWGFDRNVECFDDLEGKDWWFSRSFEVSGDATRSELCFEGIDNVGEAWLNGVHLGRHENTHTAWTVDVTEALREGENLLVVRADDGTRSLEGKDVERYLGMLPRETSGRMWLRKPQYVWGWTFAPHLVGCGIWRSVSLRRYPKIAVRDVQLICSSITDGTAAVRAICEVEAFSEVGEAELSVSLTDADGNEHSASTAVPLSAGAARAELEIQIPDAKLWWPAPLGEPHLYDCKVILESGSDSDQVTFRHGVRTIEVDQSELGEDEGSAFIFVVNGEPVFCKGSSWHPPEQLFGCVSEDKLRQLIELAAEANFNMFRVNGVGTYESDRFYELCDEHGIMIWQDFAFACSYYPDDDEGFRQAVRAEAEAVIRRIRNHASLAIWCGNNENNWHHIRSHDPLEELKGIPAPRLYGEQIYDGDLADACKRLDPTRLYWPSSPFGGGEPNSDMEGNCHAWHYQFLRKPEDCMQFQDYELDRSKFPDEFGVLGPSEMSSLERFLPPEQLSHDSEGWEFHADILEAGSVKATVERQWAALSDLGFEDFVALGQLFQGEGLAFAYRHWRRRKFKTAGAISWGYADCWGTSSTWSIIDYWLRPHAAYYHVKRALEPVQVSLQRVGDAFLAWVVNDTLSEVEAELELGFVDLPHSTVLSETMAVKVGANASEMATRLALPSKVRTSPERFVSYAQLRIDGEVVSRARSSLVDFEFCRLPFLDPEVEISRDGEVITFAAKSYVFQLHFGGGKAPLVGSDNWFDMLPGETRSVRIPGLGEEPVSCWAFGNARVEPKLIALGEA